MQETVIGTIIPCRYHGTHRWRKLPEAGKIILTERFSLWYAGLYLSTQLLCKLSTLKPSDCPITFCLANSYSSLNIPISGNVPHVFPWYIPFTSSIKTLIKRYCNFKNILPSHLKCKTHCFNGIFLLMYFSNDFSVYESLFKYVSYLVFKIYI